LFWATEGGVIRNIMDNRINVDFAPMFLFFSVWYFFTITTYGTNVPAGLFLPGMIIGCSLGNLYSKMIDASGIFEFDTQY
jgi:H+/Cl- antiporter ClcA